MPSTGKELTPLDVFAHMEAAIDGEAVRGLTAAIQFNLKGDGGGDWFVTIAEGRASFADGTAVAPTVTMTMLARDFVAMNTGRLQPPIAFMDGRLKIAGDMGLVMKFQTIFPPATGAIMRIGAPAPTGASPTIAESEAPLAAIRMGSEAWARWRADNVGRVVVDLTGADLTSLDLRGADLRGVTMGAADLSRTDLRGAMLDEAFLGGARFHGADLTDASLAGAFLNEADLSTARGVSQRQVDSARNVDYAKLPPGLHGRQSTAAERQSELSRLAGEAGFGFAVAMEDEPREKRGWFWRRRR